MPWYRLGLRMVGVERSSCAWYCCFLPQAFYSVSVGVLETFDALMALPWIDRVSQDIFNSRCCYCIYLLYRLFVQFFSILL